MLQRRMIRALFAIVSVVALTHCSVLVSAQDNAMADVSESLRDAGALVEQSSDSPFSEAMLEESVEEQGQALLSSLDPSVMFEELGDALRCAIPDAIRLFFMCAGIVIVGALCKRFCETGSSHSLSEGVGFCSAAALTAAILSTGLGGISAAEEMMEGVAKLMHSLIPVSGAVWAMGGNVTTASVGTAGLYALLTVCEGICLVSVRPVCCISGVAAVCSALSDGTVLSGFSSALKKLYNFVLSALMTALVFALGAQTAIASAADTAAARGAKLFSSSAIPVVGGAIGDTLRAVGGSVQYVKSVVGIGAVMMILALVVPPLISLMLFRLSLLLSGGFAQMLGCERENRLLGELGNIYGMLIGAVASSSVAFIAGFAIFVRCVVAVG